MLGAARGELKGTARRKLHRDVNPVQKTVPEHAKAGLQGHLPQAELDAPKPLRERLRA